MDILNYNFSLISYWIRNTFSCAFIHHFWYTSQCERLERTTTLHGRFNQTLVRLRKSPTSLSDKSEIYGHSRVTETAGSGWTRLSGISRRLLIVAERAIRIEAEIFLFNFSITNYSSYLQCSTFLFPMKRKKNTNQLTPMSETLVKYETTRTKDCSYFGQDRQPLFIFPPNNQDVSK